MIGGFPDEKAPASQTGDRPEFVFSRTDSRRYLRNFVRVLSEEIIEQDHILLGGCQSELDKDVAETAATKAIEKHRNPEECVLSYVGEGAKRIHKSGRIHESKLPEWNLIGSRLVFPEPVAQADAVIVLGGFDGTLRAVNWARLASRPILPLATFGLAARQVYRAELEDFEHRYAGRITQSEYELLSVVLPDFSEPTLRKHAQQVLALAERIISPTEVFVIMSFSDDPDLEDAYDTFVSVCDKERFGAFKVDDHLDESKRIVDEVIDTIHRSAFVIANLTEPKPNVYYEFEYAKGIGKPIIVTAKAGTILPFDVFDVPTLLWKNQKALRDGLLERISKIATKLGRKPEGRLHASVSGH